MPTPAEKLALSLEALQKLQSNGKSVIKGDELTRTHRERLFHKGCCKGVVYTYKT